MVGRLDQYYRLGVFLLSRKGLDRNNTLSLTALSEVIHRRFPLHEFFTTLAVQHWGSYILSLKDFAVNWLDIVVRFIIFIFNLDPCGRIFVQRMFRHSVNAWTLCKIGFPIAASQNVPVTYLWMDKRHLLDAYGR